MDDAPKSDPRRGNATIAADNLFRGVRRHMMPADARHVLRYLAGRRNVATEQCNPGKGTIVDETGIAEQQVKAALAWLERHGWITVHREKLQGDVNAPNQYALHVWPGDMGRWATEQQAADEKAERVAANRAKRQGAKGGAASDLGPHQTQGGAASDLGPHQTQGEAVSVPGVGPHRSQGGAVSDHKAPSEAPRQAPMEAPRGGDAPRPGAEDGQVNLFGEVKSSGESAPKKTPPKKAAGDSARRYGDAFVAGMADAGRTVSPPSASDCRLLGSVLATHAKGDDGAKLTGDAAETWLRATTAAFVRACPDPSKCRGGYSAFGIRQWLDNGRPGQTTGAKGSSYGAPVARRQPGTWASARKGPMPQPGPMSADKGPPVPPEERPTSLMDW